MNERAREIFGQYPKATKIYVDTNGEMWLNEDTAIAQSRGKKPEVIERPKTAKTA